MTIGQIGAVNETGSDNSDDDLGMQRPQLITHNIDQLRGSIGMCKSSSYFLK